MATNSAVRSDFGNAVDAITNIKTAINQAAVEVAAHRLQITKAELELVIDVSAAGGYKFSVGSVGFEASHTAQAVHTLHITLVPQPAALINDRPDIGRDLALAASIIGEVVRKAAETNPPYGLDEATVALNIKVETDGKISIFATGEVKASGASTVTLTLKQI